MKQKTKYAIGGAAIAGAIATGTYVTFRPHEFTTYIHGSEGVPHDRAIRNQIPTPTELGLYCTSDVADLTNALRGDVVISARAGSYDCRYTSTTLLSTPVVGGGNYVEYIRKKTPNAIFVTNGKACGKGVDYYYGNINLGDAMAKIANDLIAINQARKDKAMLPLEVRQMKATLSASSDEVHRDWLGVFCGELVDIQKAIELATAPTSTPIITVGFLPAVYLLLLED